MEHEGGGVIVKKYSIEPGIEPICKSHAIWGHNGSNSWPLVYLVKPKHMSDHAFRAVIDSIRLEMLEQIEVGMEEE